MALKWCFACFVFLLAAFGGAEEPWSVQLSSPCFEASHERLPPGMTMRHTVPDGFAKTGCYIWLMIYQKGFGRMTASKCPMKPSCSNFSLEAIAKYGGFWGILMTADRLLHEGSVRYTAPIVYDGIRVRYDDPVDDNVLWRNIP